MVRRTERTRGEQGVVTVRQPRDRPDLRGLQCLLLRHIGEDRGEAARKHRLARAGRADEQEIVSARRRDLQRALDVFLSHDIGKVGTGDLPGGRLPPGRRRDGLLASETFDKLRNIGNAADNQSVGKRRLRCVRRGDV